MKMKVIIPAVLLVFLLVGATLLYNALSERMPTEQPLAPTGEDSAEREIAPDFAVEDVDGNTVMLSDMRGKPVVLNFWACWCPPCREEMPEFDDVYKEVGDEVHFMMVYLADGARATRESGEAFIEENGYTFPVYYDISQEAGATYAIRSIPTTFFIDAEGYLVTYFQGALNEVTLRRGIEHILG